MERKYLATIQGDGDVGRVVLMAEREDHPDHGTRWCIVALLPDGTEEGTEVSGEYGGGLVSAIESITSAWGAEWGLEWLPSAEEMDRICGEND